MHDIIVVGGGPAGMTAALYALRNGKSVLVIEKESFGGQMTQSPKIENYPGKLQVSGMELADEMMNQILEQGADIEIETVASIFPDDGGWIVATEEGGAYEAKAVVIATGVKHRMLGLPGEDDLVGDCAMATSTRTRWFASWAEVTPRCRTPSFFPRSAKKSSCCSGAKCSGARKSSKKSCSRIPTSARAWMS